ncbi:MAG: radical SAM protein [Gemmatimonadota bacterium]|nr:radical SAM protein [Gemmatimonadota bacterium]MDH4349529.1 radical SAM protein [Gemmatimonadota bacterium]MDH5284369.1 radical SAM protein [Gemmatimonadota bacterium]
MRAVRPAYLDLGHDQLRERAIIALEGLRDCQACPRRCRVNRLDDHWSACKTGRYAVVSSWYPHLGEEDCLRGWNGSGTIFFGHCSLRCAYCQNWDISQGLRPGPDTPGVTPAQLAGMMIGLQERGCHNINLVTPEHVVPQMLEALAHAVEWGLNIPLVYNTSGYDSLETLHLLDGVVDIYMPDFKCWSPERARRDLKAADYPRVTRAAVRAMHRQVGPLVISADGLAIGGLLVRHLVLPGALDETRAILTWIASELGPSTYINLMGQYRPAGRVRTAGFPDLARRIGAGELTEAFAIAHELGLERLDTASWRRSDPAALADL